MGKRVFYLLHHGETLPDPPNRRGDLSLLGVRQLTLAADTLRAHQPTTLWHDDTYAARGGIAIMREAFPAIEVQPLPELAILVASDPPLPYGVLSPAAQEQLAGLIHQEPALHKLVTRFTIASPIADSCEVILTHGNMIRYLISRMVNAPLESLLRMNVQTGSVSRIVIELNDGERRFIVTTINQRGHLPPELWT